MIKAVSFCAILSCMAWGFAAPVYAQELPDNTDDVSVNLGGFIEKAIDAGVLIDPEGLIAETAQIKAAEPSTDCLAPYPLDFSKHRDVQLYGDLDKFRQGTAPADAGRNNIDLIKAYLSLGLYTEVIAKLNEGKSLAENAYVQLARLMDGYRQSDDRIFAKLAICYPQADFWYGASLLISNDISGADKLAQRLEVYRDLPLHLRVDVAAAVLPVLRHAGRHLLGQKLLASFSPEEIEQSNRLNVQASFLSKSSVQGHDEEIAHNFMLKIAPEMAGLFIDAEGEPLHGLTQQAIILEEVYTVLERSPDKAIVAVGLQYALENVKDYNEFAKLLSMPSLSAPVFQSEIQAYLSKRLLSDLASDRQANKFSAANFLINHPQALSGHHEEESAFSHAKRFLNDAGRAAMAVALGQSSELQFGDRLAFARVAYRQGNQARLYEVAQENLDNADIVRLAALAAIEAQDLEVFSKFETYLPKDVNSLLRLANEDAVNGTWFLSEETYDIIRKASTDEELVSLENILLLKEFTSPERSLEEASKPYSVGIRLNTTNLVLDGLPKEGGG